jgi:hypothetical protein
MSKPWTQMSVSISGRERAEKERRASQLLAG